MAAKKKTRRTTIEDRLRLALKLYEEKFNQRLRTIEAALDNLAAINQQNYPRIERAVEATMKIDRIARRVNQLEYNHIGSLAQVIRSLLDALQAAREDDE